MQKIHIISLLDHKEPVLKCLRKNEVLDIQTVSQAGQPELPAPEAGQYEYELAKIKSAIDFLEGIEPRKKSFVESFIPPRDEVAEADFLEVCRDLDCPDLVRKCEALENQLANLKNLRSELSSDLANLLPWQSLGLPLTDLASTAKTLVLPGKVKARSLAEFISRLAKLTRAAQVEVVQQTREEAFVLVIGLAQEEGPLSDLLSRSDFSAVTLPNSPLPPAQQIDRLRTLIKDCDKEIKERRLEAKELARQLNKLKYMYDHILGEKTAAEVQQKLANTKYTFVIEGWLKKADLNRLEKELSRTTREVGVVKIEPAKGEKPPVALENPRGFAPFELITNIYGTPRADEFDPSIPLAFFFALFFGLCLGDFGYGVILAAFSVYFMKRYRLPAGGQKLFQLLIFGGGVSALVGILTGSYLGISPKEIPAALLPLKQLLTSIQIIDPIKSPLTMLLFSLALGVIQILFGISLQMALRIRNKDYVSAILDDGLWFFFLSSLVFLLVANALAWPTALLAARFSIAGAVLLVLTQGRHKKNIVEKFLSGLLSLYKVSGYMGDTLSYSRLLALGMSTTIIGSVINILAGMVKGGVPGLGIVLMIVLLIFGHLFNLVIGTLGAFVHSTRLQMVEFFSKFYEGGGREFKPYRRQAEYTVLK
ncbi:V-type ATP synthase subunit I [Candidatus Margulisiibacteriota bacterium]